jgi:phage terminase large subunit GpA-like protein
MSSAQVGKTEWLLNILGYYMDYDPSPMLLLQPTLQMAEAFSKDRLAPMLRDTPALKGLVKDARARDSGNTLLHKTFPGGHITMAGANSPASLASRPVRIFLADEVDRYPISAGTEGDPLSLGGKRTTTFFNRKKIYTSTPTIKGASRIENAYEKSDMRRYYIPCSHCGDLDTLKWSNVKWDKDDNGNHLPETAYMVCESCGGIHYDHDKVKRMLDGGRWVAEKETTNSAGFHLNELYSPWKKWSEVVQDFLDAKGDTEQIKTWTNTSLGETFEEAGDQIDDGYLYARREMYESQVPAEALVMTMGVDIQADRIECEIIAWGVGEQSWNIDYKILTGDVTQPEVWKDLEELFDYEFEHESGNILHIASTCIDSGYQTQLVYDFVYKHRGRRVFAVKGVEGAGRAIVSQSIAKKTKGSRRKVDLYVVGVDDAKVLLSARLKLVEQGAGYCHFPMERDEEYFAQLTAEKMVTKFRRGFPYREWVKTRARNEAIDCRIYGHAALKLLNPNWQALESRLEQKEEVVEKVKVPETASQQHIKKVTHRPRKSGFVNRW